MGIEVIAGAIALATGLGTTASTIIAAVAVACPDDDGWNTVLLPGQEGPRAAAWRAKGSDRRNVEAVCAAIRAAPEGVTVLGLAVNDCIAPVVVEGDVMATDGGYITPGSVAVFRKKTDALAMAKVYLGASWNGEPVAAFLCLRPGPWVMHVPYSDLAELRRVSRIWRGGAWIEPDAAGAVARAPQLFTKHVVRASLPPTGGKAEPLRAA